MPVYGSCESALIQDVVTYQSNTSLKISFLQTMDKSMFNAMKQGVQTGGSILVDGLPISGYGNWDDFQEAVSRESQSVTLHFSDDRSLNFVKTFLSTQATSAYKACLDASVRVAIGVHVWVLEYTDTSVTITIRWIPPDERPQKIVVGLIGDTNPPMPPIPEEWAGNLTRDFIIGRDPAKDLKMTVGLGPYEDFVHIPPNPQPAPPPLCPQGLTGRWQRAAGGLIVVYNQKGCTLIGSSEGGDYSHTMLATFHTDGFDQITTRRQLSNECVTKMLGKVEVIDANTLRIFMFGTDGRCGDIPAELTDYYTIHRRL